MADIHGEIETPNWLTDEDITAFIADPATIQTHEQALQIIEVLDAEIAEIQAQVDAAAIESNARPLSPDRQGWLRRASYAAAMRRGHRHRVMQRDKEIRHVKGAAQQQPKRSPEERLAKQTRLLAEAEARRTAKLAEAAKIRLALEDVAQRRRELKAMASFERAFIVEAEAMLSADVFAAIKEAASLKTRYAYKEMYNEG